MNRGALLVGQSGGATAVINATLAGAIDEALDSRAFGGVIGMRGGLAGLLEGRFVDLGALNSARRDRLRATPGSAIGTGRLKATDAQLDRAEAALKRADIGGVLLIGGNDSADTAWRLSMALGKRVPVLLAPKTVDNDLEETDFCPGYPSAARFLANLVRDATWDSLSAPELYPVKLIEVPGRDAGWLPLGATLGFAERDPDLRPLVFVPEQPPVSAEVMVRALLARIESHGFVVAIVPETLRDAAGNHLGGNEPDYVDPFGHPYFPSAAESLAKLLRSAAGIRARVERPGSAARMSASLVSPVDRDAAYALGCRAVWALATGMTGQMAAIQRTAAAPYAWRVNWVPLDRVANRVRSLPKAYYDDRKLAPTEAFSAYALPLLGSDSFPSYERLDPAD